MSSEPEITSNQAEILEPGASAISLNALKLSLAQQIAPIRWRGAISRLANQVGRGTPMEEAVAALSSTTPPELRALLAEAMHTSEPASLLVEAIRVREDVRRNWRELMSLILYPTLLLVFAIAVGVAFSFMMQSMVSLDWIEDFGLRGGAEVYNNLVDQHHAIVGLAMICTWVGVVLLTLAIAGPAWAWISVVGGIAVIGKPLRWVSLQEILNRYQLFIAQGMSTTDTADAVARSFRSSGQSTVAAAIARRIHAGVPLGQAIGSSMLSDGVCRPALLMLDQRETDMAQSLRETAELLGMLVEQRCRTLSAVLPVFVLCLVGTILWATLSAYFMALRPLLMMITSLV